MAIKRKPLKPVKGWVVVGPSGDICCDFIQTNARAAWMKWTGDDEQLSTRKWWKRAGYRAVPVVVMERGKK